MLSQTARQEVVDRIGAKVGYQLNEGNLTPAVRQAITNVATVQRHLYVITELLRGEQSRVDRSTLLRLASKMGRDSEKAEKAGLVTQIAELQAEIDNKIGELVKQILDEEGARQSGQPPPPYQGKLELVQLKCPTCGASLPMPTGRFIRCSYCSGTFTIEDVSQQLKSMIQSI
jgi:hypothetical protein